MNFKHSETEAFTGILWSYRGGWLVLKDVSAIKAGLPPEKLPVDLIVHRSNLAYTQVLP